MAEVTYQNLFRMFSQLAGMTGTAMTDKAEFMEVYRLAVVAVPTHKKNIRIDRPDRLFISNPAKMNESLVEVKKARAVGRPVLIETGSLSLSELYSRLLLRERIPHNVLNAESAAKEAKIVADAGQRNAITVATSMAGRGTDIRLGDGVEDVGGLLVLGTERMANKRVDNQLRGRAGRQGSPGESVFYSSFEDRIVLENAPKRIRKFAIAHADDEKQELTHKRRYKHTIDRIQAGLAGGDRAARFQTLEYGEIFRVQRDCVYETRDALLDATDLDPLVDSLLVTAAAHFFAPIKDAAAKKAAKDEDILDYIFQNVWRDYVPVAGHKVTQAELHELMVQRLAVQHEGLPNADQWLYFQRLAVLKAIDSEWIEQVDDLEALQTLTKNQARGGRNPLFTYQEEARRTFKDMKVRINSHIVRNLLCSELHFKKDGQVDVEFP